MKVFVSGGAGFIGSHTAEALLKRGDSVVVVDELNDYYDIRQKLENLRILNDTAAEFGSQVTCYKADCCDETAMRRIFEIEKPDVICHLAARAGVRPSIQDPSLYVRTNIQGTVVMLEMARLFNIKNFVFASSSSVYGANTKVPFEESDPTEKTISPYAATKKSCEIMAQTYHHLYNIPTSGLRFFTVYGPRGRPDMAPFMFVNKIYHSISINQFGDGSSCRDYTYIDDIVDGILAVIDNPRPFEIYNLGNNRTVTLKQFIGTVERTLDRKAVLNILPDQPGDVQVTYADLKKSSKMLGYSPKWSIEAGMKSFVDWYMREYIPRVNSPNTTNVVEKLIDFESPVPVSTAKHCILTHPGLPPSPPISMDTDTESV